MENVKKINKENLKEFSINLKEGELILILDLINEFPRILVNNLFEKMYK